VGLRQLRRPTVGLLALFATLAFACLILFTTVSLTQSIRDGLRQSAQHAVGGDISLRLYHREPSDAERAFLATLGELDLSVEQRVMAQTDGENATRSTLTELKAVTPTFPLFGDVILASGQSLHDAIAIRDGIAGAVVGADLLADGQYAIGDVLKLGEVSFEIRDVITAEPGRALRLFSLGPRVIVSLDAYRQSGLMDEGKQLYWYARLKLSGDLNTDNAEVINQIEQRFPNAGWRIVNAADGVPGIERIGEFASAFVSLMGIAIFAITMSAISNALRADLDARVQQFAMLRSIGMRPRQLRASIAWQISLISAAAIAISALVSIGFVSLLTPVLGTWLGVVLHPVFGDWHLILGLIISFIALISMTPVRTACASSPTHLFRHKHAPTPEVQSQQRVSLSPVNFAKSCIVAVLFAIAMRLIDLGWFSAFLIGALIICLMMFVLLGHGLQKLAGSKVLARRAAPPLKLALRNIARPGAPTVTVAASFGLATTCVFAVILFGALAGHHLRAVLPSETPDLVFFDLPPAQSDAFRSTLGETGSVASLDQLPFIHGRATHLNGVPLTLADVPRRYHWFLRGDRGLSWVDQPTSTMHQNPVTAGAWWSEGSVNAKLASLDQGVAEAIGISVGDQLTINIMGQAYDVKIANLRAIDWTRLGLDFPILLSPMDPPFAHGVINAVGLTETASAVDVAQTVHSAFPTLPSIDVGSVLAKLNALFDSVLSGLLGLTILATIGSLLVILCGLIALRQRQVEDLAMMRALGIRPNQIAGTGALETGIVVGVIGVFGFGFGSIIAISAGQAVGAITVSQIISVLGPIGIGASVTVIVIGFAGGWVLQRSALRMQPGWRS
jgi:putative ABC transport system permease protein